MRAALRDYAIVRTSLIYDFTPANRQVGWMAVRIAQGAPVTLFTDEVRQPVWAHNLAGALLELAALTYTGVLHIAGPEPLTRWDYGRALLDAMGLLETARVEPVRAAEVAPDRPRDLTLDLTRARQALQTPLLTIAAARAAWQAGVGGGSVEIAG
ncbi:MAG: sugar nucleotide-binding protein [Anaerolineae bacterium]|nr:sugar nucleotide-binding protein [Anaerolineae bacterium]